MVIFKTSPRVFFPGAVFSSLGDLEDFRVTMKGRNAPKPASVSFLAPLVILSTDYGLRQR